MTESNSMGKIKAFAADYAEANDMSFEEALEVLAQPGKLEEAVLSVGAIGKVYVSQANEDREFAIPYAVSYGCLLYHELFVYPDEEAKPGYVVIKQTSNRIDAFHQLWQEGSQEQSQIALAAAQRGQQRVVDTLAKELAVQKATLHFFSTLPL